MPIIKKVIHYLEQESIPLNLFFLTFFFTIAIRNFIELFSDHGVIHYLPFIHYFLFYCSFAASLTLIFMAATPERTSRIIRVVLSGFVLLLTAPLLDLMLTSGKGNDMAYLLPGFHDDLIRRFFLFFGEFNGVGITPGMKIELAVVYIGSGIYFYLKNGSLIKSITATIAEYTVLFILYASVLFLLRAILSPLGVLIDSSNINVPLAKFYLLATLAQVTAIGFLTNRSMGMALLKDLRLSRMFHYQLMFVLGIVLAVRAVPYALTSHNVFNFLLLPISVFSACMYSLITNNIEDIPIDTISNSQRPLIAGTIHPEIYRKLQWLFLGVALTTSLIVSFNAFFLVLLFIGIYYVYSVPPYRIKRVPVISKLLIALNSLIVVMLGYSTIEGTIKTFPTTVTLFFLFFFTASINFIDIKDYKGDKHAGIATLPVILGLPLSKLAIAGAFFATYIAAYHLLRQPSLLPLFAGIGMVQGFLICRKRYRELPVFILYLLSVLGFIIITYIYGIA